MKKPIKCQYCRKLFLTKDPDKMWYSCGCGYKISEFDIQEGWVRMEVIS